MPAKDDTNPRAAAICLVIIAVLSAILAVFFPRFSCFYELYGIENYVIEMMAGIFGSCSIFTFICVLLWCISPHSRCITIFTQIIIVVFVLGSGIFGISVYSMLIVASSELDKNHQNNEGKNSSTSTSFISSAPIKAAEKLLAPITDLDSMWAQVSAAVENNNNNNNVTSEKQEAICRLQKQFQCMMWRGSDSCILSNSTSSGLFSDDVDLTTTSGSQPQQPFCLTCGIYTMNVTETNRPVSCFEAMIDCFAHGREKYGETGSRKVYYVSDRYNMIIASVINFFLGCFAFWKLCFREYVVPARYGDYEHGVSEDYKALTHYA